MEAKLKDRIALVTGGSKGIGREICLSLAREGALVGVNYRSNEFGALEVVRLIKAMGSEAVALKADVSSPDQAKELVDALLKKFGRVDILVNNAGILNRVLLSEMPLEKWDEMMTVFLRGTFLCVKFVLPRMLAQRYGKIITIAGTFGQYGGTSGYVHYATAKGGQIAFTKALAREVGPSNINVNAIAPGPVETEMLFTETSEEWRDMKKNTLPLRRFSSARDNAAAVVFLASEDGKSFTGQTLGANSGDVML